MFKTRAQRWVAFSASLVVISLPAFATSKSPKLCADELTHVEVVTVSSRPDVLERRFAPMDQHAGLERASFIRNLADVQKTLATQELRDHQRLTLRVLEGEHFAAGEVYVLTEMGLSKWDSNRDVEDWAVLRAELLNPDPKELMNLKFDSTPVRGFNWEMRQRRPMRQLLHILAGRRGVPGIEDELLMDLRESYAMAVAAANIVQDRRALAEEGGQIGTRFLLRDDPDRPFQLIYEAKLKHARLTKFRRAIKLPFSLSADRKLEIDDASAMNVLHMLIRLPLVSRLVEAPDLEPALNKDQLMTGALFPELLPFLLVAPKAPADEFLATWIEPDEYLMQTYAMNVGRQNGFEFAETHTKVLAADMTTMGLREGVDVELSFYREEASDSKPGALTPVLLFKIIDFYEKFPKLLPQELREFERALSRLIVKFRGLNHVRNIRFHRDSRPTGVGYRLELVDADLATYVHLFEIMGEFSRLESRPGR